MLTILLVLGVMTIAFVLALIVLGAVTISPLLLVILIFPAIDILVITAILKGIFKKKEEE